MKKTFRSLWLLLAALAVALVAAALTGRQQPEQPAVIGTSFLMNTVVEYKLYGDAAPQAKSAIEATLRGIENEMSLYIEDSQVSRLNAAAGRTAVPVSDRTYALLERCKAFSERANGIFDVTIAPTALAWGITGDHPAVPPREELDRLLELVNWQDILLSNGVEGKTALLAREGMAVDLGAVAKGYACDEARRVALDAGITSGYISIGGNLMVVGDKPDGEPFRFGVRDPRGGENDFLAVVSLPDSTMATSGDYERYFMQDGVRYHHILDPRTGFPADGELLSVSVVSADGALADFLSTWLFIAGKDFVLENFDSLGCGLIVVDTQKNVYVSEDLRAHFTPADDAGSYRFIGVTQ